MMQSSRAAFVFQFPFFPRWVPQILYYMQSGSGREWHRGALATLYLWRGFSASSTKSVDWVLRFCSIAGQEWRNPFIF